jgi:glycosyltransferase involved in cell wall biosynthesis
VVLDYRDEWNVARSSFEMLAGGLSASATDKLEEALVRSASAITVATPAYRDELLRRFSFLDPARVFAISNGYDPDDLPAQLPRPPTDKLVLTWAGTIYRLTRAHGLLEAVKRVHEREPELAKKLELRFYGRIVDTEAPAFEGMEALGVKRLGYVPHDEVLSRVAEGHWAMVLVADAEGMERMYPGKLFELMMLERPLLTVAPEGALTELVRKHRLGTVFHPRDVSGIADFLIAELRAFAAEPEALRPLDRDTTGIEQYHRRALAGRFAEVFRAVTE